MFARSATREQYPCMVQARYEQHLATGKSLPQDTIAYVAAVTSVLAEEHGELTAVRARRAVPWREAPLFIDRADACN